MSGPSDRLSTVSSTIQRPWLEGGWVATDPWDGELTARSMSPQAFFAMARSHEARWITRQVVRQPSEARYGRSPVRQVRSTQIRVLTRPPSQGLFERFVSSLRDERLGFVEQELRLRPIDWRVRDLGLVGSGWMALLDGLLVARWIDVTRVGGREVEPPAVEITYGLERLSLVAAEGRTLQELQATQSRELARQRASEEQELSRHLLECLAETELMQELERELASAERSLDQRLAVPALEAILRGVSRAEVLRARGAFRTLREARAGVRLTELAAACRELAESVDDERGGRVAAERRGAEQRAEAGAGEGEDEAAANDDRALAEPGGGPNE